MVVCVHAWVCIFQSMLDLSPSWVGYFMLYEIKEDQIWFKTYHQISELINLSTDCKQNMMALDWKKLNNILGF